MWRHSVPIIAVLAVSGCASTPKVQLGYYLPKTDASVRFVRTVTCRGNQPYSVVEGFVDVAHSADTDVWYPLNISALTGRLSNSDLKLDFYPGRRLKSVNSSYAGQGEAITKSMAMLILPRAGFAANIASSSCDYLKDYGEKGVLTLTYSAKLNFIPQGNNSAKVANVINAEKIYVIAGSVIDPDPESKLHHMELYKELGDICLNARVDEPTRFPLTGSDGNVMQEFPDGVLINAREPGTLSATFFAWRDDPKKPNAPVCSDEQRVFMTKTAPFADSRGNYGIPIPRARAFGESVVDLQFDESGALAGVKYGSKSGAAGAGNALTTLADHFMPTDALVAARLKAEADVIAAQQRLLKCRLNPEECK